MFSWQSVNSSVGIPYVQYCSSPTPPSYVEEVILKSPLVHTVKVEKLDSVIELSSEFEGKSLNLNMQEREEDDVEITSSEQDVLISTSSTPTNSLSRSLSARPPVHPFPSDTLSIMDYLRRLASMRRSQNELSTMDLTTFKHH